MTRSVEHLHAWSTIYTLAGEQHVADTMDGRCLPILETLLAAAQQHSTWRVLQPMKTQELLLAARRAALAHTAQDFRPTPRSGPP
jgi:hypothetical protein